MIVCAQNIGLMRRRIHPRGDYILRRAVILCQILPIHQIAVDCPPVRAVRPCMRKARGTLTGADLCCLRKTIVPGQIGKPCCFPLLIHKIQRCFRLFGSISRLIRLPGQRHCLIVDDCGLRLLRLVTPCRRRIQRPCRMRCPRTKQRTAAMPSYPLPTFLLFFSWFISPKDRTTPESRTARSKSPRVPVSIPGTAFRTQSRSLIHL